MNRKTEEIFMNQENSINLDKTSKTLLIKDDLGIINKRLSLNEHLVTEVKRKLTLIEDIS